MDLSAVTPNNYWYIAIVPLLPLFSAAFLGLFGRWLKDWWISFIGCGSVFFSFLVVLNAFFDLRGLEAGESLRFMLYSWISIGKVPINVSFLLDRLSLVMALVVTGVGGIIHLYSVGYMHNDPGYRRYFAYLNLFTFSMLLLVLGDNLVLMFVGWEGVGLCSYLLIGFWFKDVLKAEAGKKAFIVNRIGDFGFILGIFMIAYYTGVFEYQAISEKISNLDVKWRFGMTAATAAGLLLFLGACGKSAQIPLYIWLPDAMAGPTPVSALIHAATMVTAGVYMVARMNFLYVITPFAMTVIATIGALTAFFAATIGIAQNDIKKVLAYSTISQIGFMMVGVGVGAFSAGIFHLVTHSFFKACLFLCAGSVMHALSGELDIRNMGGLKRYLPWTRWTFLLATLAIAGCPFFSGFFSKDEILWKAFSTVNPIITWWPTFIWAVSLIAAFCTAFYMFRLYFLTFEGSCRVSEKLLHHIHESPKIMVGPLVILAGLSVIGGFIGMPHMFGVHNIFDEFLEPVFASASSYITPFYSLEKLVGMESILMVLSILVFWAGLSIAHYIYAKEDLKEAEMLAQQYPKIHKTLVQKYKIDEFYNWLVVEPSKWISEKFYRIIDVWVIDKVMVNGSAWIMKICGRILSYLQNGLVQRYAAIMAIGVIIFLYVFSSPSPEFSVNIKGNTVQVTATPKSGYKYRWDFNGDGHWDTSFSEDHRQRYTFRKKGDYTIILEIENRWGIKKKEEVDIEIK